MHYGSVLRTLAMTIAAIAALSAAIMLGLVVSAYSPLPFWDQWERVSAAQQLSNIFEPHNEHVIAIPRLFFAADAALFGGRNLFLLGVIQLVQAAHLALLVWLARRAGLQGAPLLAVGAAAAAFLFSGAQLENFYWGFQVQFVLVYLLITACFTLALLGADRLRFDLAAIGAGLAATLSLSAGVIALPAAAAGSLFIRVSWRRRLMLAAGGVATFLLYAALQSSGGDSGYGEALRHPVSVVYYAFAYLGAPFGAALAELTGSEAVELSVLVGAGGVVTASAAAWYMLRRWPVRPARMVLLLIVGAVLAAALLTALGRWHLGALQALSSRYATPVLLFWAAQTALYWSFVRAAPSPVWRARGRLALAVGTLGAVALLLAGWSSWQRLVDGQTLRTGGAYSAVLARVADPAALAGVHPSPETVLRQADVLAEQGLSVFGDSRARWIGRPVAEMAVFTDPSACLGALDAAPRFGEGGPHAGWRLDGWAWDLRAGRPPAFMVFAVDGEVRGLGQVGGARPDVVAALEPVVDPRVGFSGHARGSGDLVVYAALASDAGPTLCEVARQ